MSAYAHMEKTASGDGYRCIVADPPWYHRSGKGHWGSAGGNNGRGADAHYPILKTDEIIKVILDSSSWRPAQSCHLWLWVTNNFLRDGLAVIDALGFRYVTNLAWVKRSIGLGFYLRGQHELCLFATRGPSMPPLSRDVPSVILVEKAEHSQKPEAFYSVVERVSPGPRLELFAREKRLGWDTFGNDVRDTLFTVS